MSQSQTGTITSSLNGRVTTGEPDPQAVPKAERRHFSARVQAAHPGRSGCLHGARPDRGAVAPGRAVLVAPGQVAQAARPGRSSGRRSAVGRPIRKAAEVGPAAPGERAAAGRACSKPRRSSRSKKNLRDCLG